MANNSPIETAYNIFYRGNYRLLLNLLRFMFLLNFLLVLFIGFLVTRSMQPATYATNIANKTTPLFPLSEPIVSQKELLQWASQAATAIYTYNFVNYKESFQTAAQYFTPSSWKHFMDKMNQSKGISSVLSKKLSVTAVVNDTPIIIEEGPLLGNYSWKIQVPILVTYESATEKKQQSLIVTMLVTRVPTSMYARGIAIIQFYSTERALKT